MESIEGEPSKNVPPPNILHKPKEDKKKYFDEIIGKFVDEYVIHDPDAEKIRRYEATQERCNNTCHDHAYSRGNEALQKTPQMERVSLDNDEDFVRNYGLQVINLTVLLLQLKDTAAGADGDHDTIDEKLLLSFFKYSINYSKYVTEMLLAILQKEALLTERMAEKLRWGKFINWKDGKGRNIENDLAQEMNVKLAKSLIASMGANNTKSAITRATKAVAGIREIIDNYDSSSGVPPSSTRHARRSSKQDEVNMIRDLRKISPFKVIPGRNHLSFPDIAPNERSRLDFGSFHQWIRKHMRQMGT